MRRHRLHAARNGRVLARRHAAAAKAAAMKLDAHAKQLTSTIAAGRQQLAKTESEKDEALHRLNTIEVGLHQCHLGLLFGTCKVSLVQRCAILLSRQLFMLLQHPDAKGTLRKGRPMHVALQPPNRGQLITPPGIEQLHPGCRRPHRTSVRELRPWWRAWRSGVRQWAASAGAPLTNWQNWPRSWQTWRASCRCVAHTRNHQWLTDTLCLMIADDRDMLRDQVPCNQVCFEAVRSHGSLMLEFGHCRWS